MPHNMPGASTVPQLSHLTHDLHLVSSVELCVTCTAVSKDALRQLPSLPQALGVTELDLWDGELTYVQRLTVRVSTNLQHLYMPDGPTQRQLQNLRRLGVWGMTGCKDVLLSTATCSLQAVEFVLV